jgi:hypothetical protein
MTVENHWRQLKHEFLHSLHHPRLDLLVWILINKVIPAYFARAELLNDEYRLGRSKSLTTYQTYFKKDWLKLGAASVSGKDYDTNIKTWTCKCGRQKYNAHHLCKHLVQAVAPPPVKFWQNVQRRRTTPLY